MRCLALLKCESLISTPVSSIFHFMPFIHTWKCNTCMNVTSGWNDVASLLLSPSREVWKCHQLQKVLDLPVLQPIACSCRLHGMGGTTPAVHSTQPIYDRKGSFKRQRTSALSAANGPAAGGSWTSRTQLHPLIRLSQIVTELLPKDIHRARYYVTSNTKKK